MPEEAYKRCSRCGEEKPLGEFGRNASKHDGRQSYCRSCSKSYRADYRANIGKSAPSVTQKRCTKCGQTKLPESFYRSADSPDGLMWHCIECSNARARDWEKANPDKREHLRQRAHARNPDAQSAYNAGWAKRNPEKVAAGARRARERYPEKVRARKELMAAVHSGTIDRPTVCDRCGGAGRPFSNGRHPIEAHHADYSKPLVVEWLCRDCHNEIHATKKGGDQLDPRQRTQGPRRRLRDQRGK